MSDYPLEQNSHTLQQYSEARAIYKVINSSLALNDAIALIKQDRVRFLLIESELKLAGILTEQDLVKIIFSKKDLSLLNVAQVMSQASIVLNEAANISLAKIASIFQRYHICYIPLINNVGKGVGIITPGSIINVQDVNKKIKSPEKECLPESRNTVKHTPKKHLDYFQLKSQNQKLKVINRHLQQQLQRRHYPIKEINHQIKNNLQVVSALLDLQSEQVQDQATYLLLEKSQSRIQTIALMYEQLYNSRNVGQVDFTDYVTSLTQYLYDSFIEDYKSIELILNMEPIQLDVDLATSCGLIINELVTNSLLHGFTNQERGQIQIDFFLDQNNFYNVQIKDNGTGIDPKISIKNNLEFLGMSIVESLITEQLKGTWKIFSRDGCVIQIAFPKKKETIV